MWKVVFLTGIVYYLYIILGGGLFMYLEKEISHGKVDMFNGDISLEFEEINRTLLEKFSEKDIELVIISWNNGWTKTYFAESVEPGAVTWTYSTSFFFAFHLCSTIGYGNVVPETIWGQYFSMLYSLIGIPVHTLYFKMLSENFAQCYQETLWKIKRFVQSRKKMILGDFVFFISWSLVFFVLPSLVFMFTEYWNFVEGLYYSFITLSTVGFGDYVAGSGLPSEGIFIVYNIFILIWMIYGLAFTTMMLDYLTHLYQMNLLFTFTCTKKSPCKFKRVYIDIEKMDIHFRLLRAEGIRHHYSLWGVREGTRLAVGFQTNHMFTLGTLCERIQGEIIELLKTYGEEEEVASDKMATKDTSHIKESESLVDAFPVKERNIFA